MLRAIVAAGLSFMFFIVVHFAHFHFFKPAEKTRSLLCVAFLGLIVFVVMVFVLPSEADILSVLHIGDGALSAVFAAVGAIFYVILIIGYFNFYLTADRSISLRMLMIVAAQPGQTMAADKLLATYDRPMLFGGRIDDLVYGGSLERDGDVYRVTAKGRLALAFFRFFNAFMHLKGY